jgi:Na+/proline symporter
MTSTFVTVAANPDLAKGLTIPGYVPVWGMVFLLSWIIPVGLGWPSHTHMYQKMISAKRSIISRAYPFIIAITFPLAILSGYVIAMTGRAFVTLPQGMRPDQIFVWQAQLYFHPLALGFIGAAGIAAMQSSLDAQAMGVASMVANDFAKRIGKITERGLARLTLAVRFILGILAIWAAITLPAPILKLGALSSAFGACTIPALTAALTGWRFATKHGLWTSVAGGFITTLVLAGQIPGTPKWLIHYGGIYAGFWGVIVSVVLLLLVSALTPGSRPSEKTVKAFKEVGW